MENKVALKSGYYFMIFNKSDIPFFDELKQTNTIVNFNDTNYNLYEAPTWELAQRIDGLMGSDFLGYSIDDYSVDNDIKI